MMVDKDFCISSYLAFRYVVKPGIGWKPGMSPEYPCGVEAGQVSVRDAKEVVREVRRIVGQFFETRRGKTGILLSSGIDSAIIGALMPKGTRAYTIRFQAEDAVDEVAGAKKIADHLGFSHCIVDVGWGDYEKTIDFLMRHKKSPLHPAEAGLYKAALTAAEDGVRVLVVGNGADSTFGGMDKLLSKDWGFDEFVARYTFLNPIHALKRPKSMRDYFEPYRRDSGVDVVKFLKTVHGLGIIQMFENAVRAGGCEIFAPFEKLKLGVDLDMARIRRGESKYILREVFGNLFPGFEAATKIAFARPMTQWLDRWSGPKREEFREDLDVTDLTGEQKWQLYCLERFLNLMDAPETPAQEKDA